MKLLAGDPKGLKFFELATGLDPTNAELFYQQGLALYGYGKERGTKKYLLRNTEEKV